MTTSVSDYATIGSGNREFIKLPNGNLVVFYWSDACIKFRFSLNGGQSWSGENDVSTSTYHAPFGMEVVTDSSNNLYLVYREGEYGAQAKKFCKFT